MYVSLLESPSLSERIKEPEIKLLMDDIMTVYHTEKPTIHMN